MPRQRAFFDEYRRTGGSPYRMPQSIGPTPDAMSQVALPMTWRPFWPQRPIASKACNPSAEKSHIQMICQRGNRCGTTPPLFSGVFPRHAA
jgi:hypothetical protein